MIFKTKPVLIAIVRWGSLEGVTPGLNPDLPPSHVRLETDCINLSRYPYDEIILLFRGYIIMERQFGIQITELQDTEDQSDDRGE